MLNNNASGALPVGHPPLWWARKQHWVQLVSLQITQGFQGAGIAFVII